MKSFGVSAFLSIVLFMQAGEARAAFTFEALRDLIVSRNLKTIEEVLPALPAEYRTNYVLVRKSASLQEATDQNPRVLMFGSEGSLTLAFNGFEGALGHKSIELFQYRKETRVFEFRKIDFSGPTPAFSDKNPASCLECHRAEPGPLWSNYSEWPETYGNHDPLTNQQFDQLKAAWRTHPRYRHLVQAPGGIRASGNTTNPNAGGIGGATRDDGPPWIMGYYFSDWNSDRIASRVLESPLYRAHQDTFLGFFAFCAGFPKREFLARIEKEFSEVFPRREHEELYSEMPAVNNGMDPDARLLFMMEKLLTGLAIYRWDTKLGPGPNNEGSAIPQQRAFLGHSSMDELIFARVLYLAGIFTANGSSGRDGFGLGDDIRTFFTSYMSTADYATKCQDLVKKAKRDLTYGW